MTVCLPDRNFIIYKVTNLVNDKVYIGQTVKTLEQRKIKHISDTRNGSVCAIHRAMRKYGTENFFFETLFYCLSKEEMNRKEIETIKAMYAKGPAGYNATEGGEGSIGRIVSGETREKMSVVHRGNKVNLGRKATDETKAKLSVIRTGHKYYGPSMRSPEWIAKMKTVNKGNTYRLGLKVTDETKAKMRVSALGRKHTEQAKAKIKAAWVIRKQKMTA